jgi:hypothetical protein
MSRTRLAYQLSDSVLVQYLQQNKRNATREQCNICLLYSWSALHDTWCMWTLLYLTTRIITSLDIRQHSRRHYSLLTTLSAHAFQFHVYQLTLCFYSQYLTNVRVIFSCCQQTRDFLTPRLLRVKVPWFKTAEKKWLATVYR